MSDEEFDLQLERMFEIDANLRNYEVVFRRRFEEFKKLWKLIDSVEEPGGINEFTRSYQRFGINVNPDGSVLCCEWCPSAEQLSIWGEFNDWSRVSHKYTNKGNGIWELTIPPGTDGQCVIPHNSLIKLIIVNKDKHYHEIRVSPWAHYVTQDEITDVFAQRFWNPPSVYRFRYPRPERPDQLRIYEAHVGISSEEEVVATYKHFTDNVLPRIQNLGYNAVQLMAIMEHAYYASFGYQVTNFFAASSRYGTPEQLKELIDVAHSKGLVVLLDLTHSHASKNVLDGLNKFDGTDGCYFHTSLRGHHDLWDSRLFNYSEFEVLRFLLSNLRWWVEEYRFDGFRFDGITSMMYHHHGLDGTGFFHYDDFFGGAVDMDALMYLMLSNHLLHSFYPSFIITIAEDVSGMPGLSRPINEGGIGFDYRLAMATPNIWIKLLKEPNDENWNMGFIVWTLVNRRYREKYVAYVECHDQALVGDMSLAHRLIGDDIYWHMSVCEPSTPSVERGVALHKMFRLITHSLGGESYLNFIGNEFGHPEWLDFPREGNDDSYLYARRQWSLADNGLLHYHSLCTFDRELNHLEMEYGWLNSEQAYISRVNEGDKVIVYERAQLLFIFNFHPFNSYNNYRVGSGSHGIFKVVLDTDDKMFGGSNRVNKDSEYKTEKGNWDGRDNSLLISLPSRVGLVLSLQEQNSHKESMKTPATEEKLTQPDQSTAKEL